MAQVSDWSTLEQNNVKLDDLTLSGEGGLYSNKIMCAVKAKFDDVDGKLAKVQGAYVFKGTKADMTALEAVTSPSVGDVYSVTALGGENYAWDGTAWDALGTSDANVVHKTGDETVGGTKEFTSNVVLVEASGINYVCGKPAQGTTYGYRIEVRAAPSTANGGFMSLYGKGHPTSGGNFSLTASNTSTAEDRKSFVGTPDGSLSWDGQAIQTSSDERLKTQLAAVPDDVLDAWGDVQWGQFQFLDAVGRKGEAARLHLGLIAQRVKAVFDARGLDACAYGILCHEEREATKDSPAVDLWMVRYEEALAMESAFQRRRADRLEARIEALEDRLNGVN